MSLCGMYLCLAYDTWFVSVFYSSVLFRLCMIQCIVQTWFVSVFYLSVLFRLCMVECIVQTLIWLINAGKTIG
jgi:hypothetical protein